MYTSLNVNKEVIMQNFTPLWIASCQFVGCKVDTAEEAAEVIGKPIEFLAMIPPALDMRVSC